MEDALGFALGQIIMGQNPSEEELQNNYGGAVRRRRRRGHRLRRVPGHDRHVRVRFTATAPSVFIGLSSSSRRLADHRGLRTGGTTQVPLEVPRRRTKLSLTSHSTHRLRS